MATSTVPLAGAGRQSMGVYGYLPDELRELLVRHPSLVVRDVWEAGVPTLGAVFASWAAATLVASVVKRRRAEANASEWSLAVKLCVLNWVGIVVATPFAGPVLGVLFGTPSAVPTVRPAPAVASLVVTLVVWDAWSYVAHRFLHAHAGVFRAVHRPHHRLHTAFPLAAYAVHPVELAIRSVGFVLGVLVSRTAFFSREERMPLVLVWLLMGLAHLGAAFAYASNHVCEHQERGGVAGRNACSGNFALVLPVWDSLGGTSLSVQGAEQQETTKKKES